MGHLVANIQVDSVSPHSRKLKTIWWYNLENILRDYCGVYNCVIFHVACQQIWRGIAEGTAVTTLDFEDSSM
jgi:hypothetical protein